MPPTRPGPPSRPARVLARAACWLVLLAGPACPAAAAPEPAVQVHGNERTATGYVVHLARQCLERSQAPAGEPALAELEQCLYNSRLFAEVSVTRPEPGVLDIVVDERWTLIPLPYARVDDGERSAGLFVMERNFLGRGKLAIAGYSTGTRGDGYVLMYRDPSILQSRFEGRTALSVSERDFLLREGREETDGFRERRRTESVGLGYRIGDTVPSLELTKDDMAYEAVEPYTPPENVSILRAGIELRHGEPDFRLYYSHGLAWRLNLAADVERSDEAARARLARTRLTLGLPATGDHAVTFRLEAGALDGGTKVDAFRLGRSRGFRGILPRSAWAGRFASFSADYRVPVRQLDLGTWTIAPFADLGWLRNRGGEGSERSYAAAGIGTYFFLKRVAVPGFGLELGANSEYQRTFASLSVGFGF